MSLFDNNTIKTRNMRTAAVLIASGYEYHEARTCPDRPELVEFTFLAPVSRMEEAKRLLASCSRGYDVHVHLGQYEAAFRQVRGIIEDAKGAVQ